VAEGGICAQAVGRQGEREGGREGLIDKALCSLQPISPPLPPSLPPSPHSTLLIDALTTAGLQPFVPEGGFFIVADTSKITVPSSYLAETTPASPSPMSRDWAFCRYLTLEAGVAAIPPSAFYKEDHKKLAENHARFAFCKADESIIEAKKRFQKWKGEEGGNGGGAEKA